MIRNIGNTLSKSVLTRLFRFFGKAQNAFWKGVMMPSSEMSFFLPITTPFLDIRRLHIYTTFEIHYTFLAILRYFEYIDVTPLWYRPFHLTMCPLPNEKINRNLMVDLLYMPTCRSSRGGTRVVWGGVGWDGGIIEFVQIWAKIISVELDR